MQRAKASRIAGCDERHFPAELTLVRATTCRASSQLHGDAGTAVEPARCRTGPGRHLSSIVAGDTRFGETRLAKLGRAVSPSAPGERLRCAYDQVTKIDGKSLGVPKPAPRRHEEDRAGGNCALASMASKIEFNPL
jgi:hypothetical protein